MNKIITNNLYPSHCKKITNHFVPTQSFGQILNNTIKEDVKFSKHAAERLQDRNIQLDQKEMEKINMALNKAKQKGIKETLILMNNKAFVANVCNKTIITVATDTQLKENVFTNIDGAVIV